jgi:hypothetical protein
MEGRKPLIPEEAFAPGLVEEASFDPLVSLPLGTMLKLVGVQLDVALSNDSGNVSLQHPVKKVIFAPFDIHFDDCEVAVI